MALITTFVVACVVSTTLACNGYEARNLKMEPCGGEPGVIQLDKVAAQLKQDCTVVVNGCFNVLKQIDWGNGSYSVEKKAAMGMPMKFSGKNLQLCKLLEDSKKNPEVSMVFSMFNLEQKCPMKAGKICGNPKGVSVAKYKDHMKMMVGDYEGVIDGTTNGGPICVKIGMSIVNKDSSTGGFGKPSMPTIG